MRRMRIVAFVCGLALAILVPFELSSPPAGATTTVTAVRSGIWSDAATWGGTLPSAATQVSVPAGISVRADVDATFAGMNIDGAVIVDPARSVTLQSSQNVVVDGVLQMHPAVQSMTQTLRFIGVNEAAFVGGGMTAMGASAIASDVGLWVLGDGLLDAVGTSKTAWLPLQGGVPAAGTTVPLSAAPQGWLPADAVTLTPSEPISAGSGSYKNFDDLTLTSVNGSTVGVSAAAHAHPYLAAHGAELLNLTRNVNIEGTPTGRTHILIMTMRPQIIENVGIRYVGPRQGTSAVLGRYGLHFHHGGDAVHGSLVQGVVIRDDGSHAFVAHDSNGVTFRDDIAYGTGEDAYWWDGNPDTRTPGPESNDVLYQHDVAAKVVDPNKRGYRLAGFSLMQGLRNVARDNVAVGVQGTKGAAGFVWPESFGVHKTGLWTFDQGNIAHNNQSDGIFAWQNDSQPHTIVNFTGYHNGYAGIEIGAYNNRYRISQSVLYGDAVGVQWHILSDAGQAALTTSLIDGAGLGSYAVQFVRHTEAANGPIFIARNTFTANRKASVSWASSGPVDVADFIDNTMSAPAFSYTSSGGMQVRVQDSAGAYSLTPLGACVGSPVAAWNLCRAVIAPFAYALRP